MKATNNTVGTQALQSIWGSKLESTFSKFSTSVALHRVPVTIKQQHNVIVPAYSTADEIVLNHDVSNNIASATSLRRLKGLTIHELAHVLYTPRSRTTVGKFLKDNRRLFNAFNILEDSRIENLMVARMSGVKPWLVNVVVTELLEDASSPIQVAGSYALVYGRKYLPAELVLASKTAFEALYPEVVPALRTIVDQYIRLTFHAKGDQQLAMDLIVQFQNKVLDQINPPNSGHEHDVATPNSGSNQIDNKRAIDKDMSAVEQMTQDQQTEIDQLSDEQEDGTSDGTSDKVADATEQLTDVAKQVLQDVEAETRSDVKSARDQILDAASAPRSNDPDNANQQRRLVVKPANKFYLKHVPPSAVARANASAFARHLADIKAMSDPYWERKTDSGKLNVRNFILDRNIDEAFDRWDDSMSDVTDIEAVILLDVSGSMYNMLDDAYDAMWSIKRAFDSIEANATVIQYGSSAVELYRAQERAGVRLKRTDEGNGGTYPLGALRKARDILASSSRAIKMLLVITDGAWSQSESCEEVIISLRAQGVLTGLAYLIDPKEAEDGVLPWWMPRDPDTNEVLIDAHRCEVAMDSTDPGSLVLFAKALADLSRAKLTN